MVDSPLHHPERDELVAFGLGKLPPDEATEIETHLGECEVCCETLLELQDDTFVALVRRSPEPNREEPGADVQATIDSKSGVSSQATTMAELPDELRHHQRYEILELVGRGGMGDVYKAQHKVMNRIVALKVIKPELVRNSTAVDRFQREVQAAARLHHGNIVTAYDAEQAGDLHFLVMEFVDGINLSQAVRDRGALPTAEACHYIRQAALGLEHARQSGMVHRDIKPHNLMLTDSDDVKILDFGLANFASEVVAEQAEGEVAGSRGGTLTSLEQLTQMGTMMGTPDYIAPEQAEDARTADIRSDIYSLGCTFCFLLTGKPLFEAGSVTDKLQAHAEHAPPKLTDSRGDVPPELQRVVDRMLAKDPARRFQTPAEVADALAGFVDRYRTDGGKGGSGDGFPAAVAEPMRFGYRVLVAAGALSVIAAILAIGNRGWILFQYPEWCAPWLVFGGMSALPLGLLTLWAAFALKRQQSRKVVQGITTLNLLPLNPAAVMMFPLMAWLLRCLRRPEVLAAFEPGSPQPADAVYSRTPGRICMAATLLIGAGFLGTIIHFGTDSGDLIIDVHDPSLTVRIERNGRVMRLLENGDTRVTFLPSGQYDITVPGADDRVTITPNRVWIFRGAKEFVTISRGDSAMVSDEQRLQGTWVAVSGFHAGQSTPLEQVPMQRVVFSADTLTSTMPAGLTGEAGITTEGVFQLKTDGNPKQIWVQVTGRSNFMRGIYKLEGDLLTVCMNQDRNGKVPTSFDSPPGSMISLIVLRRTSSVSDASPQLTEAERLQGKWVPVSGHMRMKAMTAEQLTQMSITFEGSRVTLTDPDSGTEIPAGTFTIGGDRDPRHITMTAPDGSETLPGIFQFAGDQLRLAWVDEDYARPTDFAPSDKADYLTVTLRRAPVEGPAPGETERDVLKAANEFLAVMDAGNFGELYDMSASWAKRKTTRGKTSQTHQTIRDSFGKVVHRTLHRVHQIDQDPSLPIGQYAVVLYKSRFERQSVLWETLVLNVDNDGQWRVNTYAWTLEPPTLPEPKEQDSPVATQQRQAALTAAQTWLQLVDAGEYGDAWEACAEQTRKADDKQTLVSVYTRLFQSTGTLNSRELLTNKYATDPSGEYVNIQYDTQFANTRVTETVALTKEEDAQWRVSGYFHDPRSSAPTPPRQTPPQGKTGILTDPPSVPTGGLPTGQNLIIDPSLENTQLGGLPQSWSAWLDDGPDFKCEVVEGGVAGKHCLQISGRGTRGVVFATSIPMDRTRRYALKGHVKVEGDAGTWAVIKLNYFNKTGWLGVDDRVGVTSGESGWQSFEKTDRANAFPEATLIVPTCHIEGNGTAWFDDLEVIAYDRDELPEDFDKKHGKNNRMYSLE